MARYHAISGLDFPGDGNFRSINIYIFVVACTATLLLQAGTIINSTDKREAKSRII